MAEREAEIGAGSYVEPGLARLRSDPHQCRRGGGPSKDEEDTIEKLGAGHCGDREGERPLEGRVVPLPARPKDGGREDTVDGGEAEERGTLEVDPRPVAVDELDDRRNEEHRACCDVPASDDGERREAGEREAACERGGADDEHAVPAERRPELGHVEADGLHRRDGEPDGAARSHLIPPARNAHARERQSDDRQESREDDVAVIEAGEIE
jgi:hypothetical protein